MESRSVDANELPGNGHPHVGDAASGVGKRASSAGAYVCVCMCVHVNVF